MTTRNKRHKQNELRRAFNKYFSAVILFWVVGLCGYYLTLAIGSYLQTWESDIATAVGQILTLLALPFSLLNAAQAVYRLMDDIPTPAHVYRLWRS